MIRFLQPEWLWLLALLPMVMLLRGRRGPVAAVEFSDVGLARQVARKARTRAGREALEVAAVVRIELAVFPIPPRHLQLFDSECVVK